MHLRLALATLLLASVAHAGDEAPITPSADQAAWQDLEVGMFCHFGINTFHNLEWSDGTLDPKTFQPERIDADQWVRVAKDLGAKYLVLTAKHHDGFCLWPTETTDYGVKSSPYQGGKGDVVGEVVAACRKAGMPVGLYLSPWDRHEPSYKDKAAYDRFYARQLTELTTRYGPLVELWFDGAGSEGREYDWPAIMKIAHANQPHAMIFNMGEPTIRWAGNENGVASDPNWNVVPADQLPLFNTGKGKTDGHGTVWLPAECDVPIRSGWFYHTDNEKTLKSLDHLVDLYEKSVGRGANLLLNIAPGRDGRIPDADAKRAKELGDAIRKRYGTPLATTKGEGATVELKLPGRSRVDAVVVQEDITKGERIRGFTVEVEKSGSWAEVARGTSVGHKKIVRFPAVETEKLRVTAAETVAPPVIRTLAAFGSSREAAASADLPGRRSEWEGHPRYDFDVAGRPVIVVAPEKPATGKPWIWRAEFFGHRPEADLALIDRGFHLVYMDTGNTFGCPDAMDQWEQLYTMLTKQHGFSAKPALEGLSRGGLSCFHWAARHPDRVACIYADAPVCDFKSWPAGKGKGKGSPSDWKKLIGDYHFADEKEALAYDGNPIDQLRPLVRAGIPLLHVCGDADDVVPYEENTALVKERYERMGGTITVIVKRGVGHHPHALDDPTPIVEFVARHAASR